MKYLEYVSETLLDYCLDVCLSVYKRISLDGKYFLWILRVKFGKKSVILTVYKKKVKHYFISNNFGNTSISLIYLWSITYADSFDKLLAMV